VELASATLRIDALLDSNVLIAMLAEAHEHHGPSLNLLVSNDEIQFAVAVHSYAEAYSTLTRRGDRAPFRFTPEEAWAALESVRAVTNLVGLTAPQTFDAIKSYAETGGIGARLHDRLIGEAAVAYSVPRIITWNVGHMRSLFPQLTINTPKEFGTREGATS
jgi:predicted nucleic acid-binding protein